VKSGRTIIIGDVHGCSWELKQLVEKLCITPEDRVYFVGDLINKGPNSLKVYRRFRAMGAQAVIGNHELAVLHQVDGKRTPTAMFKKLKRSFGSEFKAFVKDLRSWPSFIEEDDFLLVHAGVIPGKGLTDCKKRDLANIRTWDGIGDDLQNPKNPPWYRFYEGEKLVVFGHWAAKGLVNRPNVIGLDTGCVYGKELSALILPERKIVSVKAREAYCLIRRRLS